MAEIVIHSRQVEMLPLDALKGYDRNARTHPAAQIQVLASIVREQGWTNPLLIDDEDVIVAGHGRLEVARKLKMTEVPCVRLSNLSPEQIRIIRLSDNQTGLLSGWADDLLKLELGDLQGLGADLSLTGFSSLELTSIFATQEGNTEPDEAPEPPAIPVSRLGDLWTFEGGHRIICGDCTSKEVVDRLLEGRKPHLLISDPPYGVSYDADWRNRAVRSDGSPIAGRAIGKVSNDDRCDWREAWALFAGDVAYVWHAGRHASEVQASLETSGFEIRSQIIWAKSNIAIGRGHYHFQHEPAWYCVRKGANGHWSGDRKQSTLWQIDKPQKSETGHSTQKPVECMARPMRNNSAPGDLVYDPFMGSGTTCIAAHMNKRVALGCEIDPAYIDVICQRMIGFTGAQPILAETGETFEAVKARRLEVV